AAAPAVPRASATWCRPPAAAAAAAWRPAPSWQVSFAHARAWRSRPAPARSIVSSGILLGGGLVAGAVAIAGVVLDDSLQAAQGRAAVDGDQRHPLRGATEFADFGNTRA